MKRLPMRRLSMLLIIISPVLFGQSKSIRNFRSEFRENSNIFLYSSTLRMLNPEENPGLAEVLSGIDEIMVLNYDRTAQRFAMDDLAKLKNDLDSEGYEILMKISEKGYGIDLMAKQKRGRNTGMVGIIEHEETMVLIDITGSMDMSEFMELWKKINTL